MKGQTAEPHAVATPARKRNGMAAMVREIELVGPNMAEVARRLKAPKESVSYSFRTKILNKRYSVHARADRGAMGLREVSAVVDIADEYASSVQHVLDGMEEHWFLHDYARTLPDGKFILGFTLPEEHYEEFPRLMKRLTKAGLVTKVHHVVQVSWRRLHPMRAEHFNFKKGRWEFDWNQPSKRDIPEIAPRTPKQKFDSMDIRIFGYLNTDATIPIKEIAQRMGVSSKTAYRHAQHIEERHLINQYRLGWIQTQWNPELGKPYAAQHKFAFVTVNVLDATAEEQARLSKRINHMPFIIGEGGGRDYVAEFGFPLEQMVEAQSYLRETLEPVAKRSRSFMIDPSCAMTFPPPRRLVNDETGDWVFDIDEQTRMLEEQMRTVREEERKSKRDETGPPAAPQP